MDFLFCLTMFLGYNFELYNSFWTAGPTSGSEKTYTKKQNEQMKKLSEEIGDPEQRRKSMRIEELRLGRYPYGKATIVRHVQLQKETVKRMVQQNCHSWSLQGNMNFTSEPLFGIFQPVYCT